MDATSQRRDRGLDGLRGFAALIVFGVHIWIYQLPNTLALRRDSWPETLLFEGRVSFVMFFVLSAYLLYRPFARAALAAGRPVSVRNYLLRRAARVMPAYYLALAGTAVLVATAGDVPGRRTVSAGEFPLFLVFAQNYSPDTLLRFNAATWTLSIEVAFYLLLPLFGLLALRRSRAGLRGQIVILLGLVVLGLGWNVLDFFAGWGPVASHALPSFLPYFACGMLAALAVEWRRAEGLPDLGRRASALLVGTALVTLLLNGYWHATDRSPDGFVIETFADLGAAVAFALIIAAMVMGTGPGLGWLAWRPISWTGQISYGLYLWHIPLIVWARGHGLLSGDFISAYVLVLPVAILFGAASWYLIEQPLMRRAGRHSRTVPADASQRSQARTIALANPRP